MKPKRKTKPRIERTEDNQKYFVAINQELKAIRSEMVTKNELDTKLKSSEERIFQHFDVAVEKIESSLRGC